MVSRGDVDDTSSSRVSTSMSVARRKTGFTDVLPLGLSMNPLIDLTGLGRPVEIFLRPRLLIRFTFGTLDFNESLPSSFLT